MNKPLYDSDGRHVKDGDVIEFSYGIPPILVIAPIVRRGKHLIALTTGHSPATVRLARLHGMGIDWYKRGK